MDESEKIIAIFSEGLSPAQIATRIGCPTADVVASLSKGVDDGRIRRSEILFTLDKDLRNTLEMSPSPK